MGKWFVIVWVVVVIGTIVGMQAALFGTRGLPRWVKELVPTSTQTPDGSGLMYEKNGHSGNEKGMLETAASDVAVRPDPNAQASEPRMVQPESLAQGFIVVVTDKTRIANTSSPIYMPSSHNGWNPADPKAQLTAQSDMRWRLVFEKPTLDSRIAFKFARGSWEKVESDADFKDIENRMLPMVDVSKLAPGEKPVIELEIVAWKDQSPSAGPSASDRYRTIPVASGRLERVEVVGGGAASLSRDALVWLPPGYDAPENKARTYPVLYLQDGQNVFQKLPGVPGEWEADETAGKLIDERKIQPLIIVAIPNAGGQRSSEYLPIAAMENVKPRGAEYIAFLVSEVMPRIERNYRVKTGPEHTTIGGSSLGAVISMEAATTRADVFGSVLLESMPLGERFKPVFTRFAQSKAWPKKLYFGMGGKEGFDNAAASRQWTAGAQAFKELAAGKGLNESTFKYVLEPDAVHNEEAWAKRFGAALEFLYPAEK